MGDHHPFSQDEIATLTAEGGRAGLTPVTTEKDLAWLGRAPGTATIVPFKVTTEFDDPAASRKFVTDLFGKARAGKFRRT